MSTEKNDDEPTSSEGVPARAEHGQAAGAPNATRVGNGDLGGDIVAFLLDSLAANDASVVALLRERTLVGARLVRQIGFDRARPYLVELRTFRRLIDRLYEIPERTLDP